MILMPHLLRQLVLQTCMITSSYSCAFELFCEAPFREKEVLGSSMPFQTATFSHLLKDLESFQNVTWKPLFPCNSLIDQMTALVTGDRKGFSQSHTIQSRQGLALRAHDSCLGLVPLDCCELSCSMVGIPLASYPTSTMEKPCGLLSGTKTKSISSFSNYYILPYAGWLLWAQRSLVAGIEMPRWLRVLGQRGHAWQQGEDNQRENSSQITFPSTTQLQPCVPLTSLCLGQLWSSG